MPHYCGAVSRHALTLQSKGRLSSSHSYQVHWQPAWVCTSIWLLRFPVTQALSPGEVWSVCLSVWWSAKMAEPIEMTHWGEGSVLTLHHYSKSSHGTYIHQCLELGHLTRPRPACWPAKLRPSLIANKHGRRWCLINRKYSHGINGHQ